MLHDLALESVAVSSHRLKVGLPIERQLINACVWDYKLDVDSVVNVLNRETDQKRKCTRLHKPKNI